MRDSRRLAALHAALRFVITSETRAEHKAILIDVLTQALRDDETAELSSQADECVMHLAAPLHRDPQAVRDKATELGLGVAVDYRFAKTIKQTRDE